MANIENYKTLNTKWAISSHRVGSPELDALIDISGNASGFRYTSLHVQTIVTSQSVGASSYILVKNLTITPISIDQLLNFNSISDRVLFGASYIDLAVYFNPNLLGATIGGTGGSSYANNEVDGFVDVTTSAVSVNILTGFNTTLNGESLHLSGGEVSNFQTNQSIQNNSVNDVVSFNRPFMVLSGQSIVIEVKNVLLSDTGTATKSKIALSGRFITAVGIPKTTPNNLITESGNNLITEGGDNLVSE